MPGYLSEDDPKYASALPAEKRYTYMIAQAARREEVWGLWGEGGWVAFRDGEGRELAPVWPSEGLALDWKPGRTEGAVPRKMDIDYWMDRWMTSMMNTGRMVAVFPAAGDTGLVVTPSRLLYDMRAETELYEYR